jgi:hypothetical protein
VNRIVPGLTGGIVASLALTASVSQAAEPWVDRPLTLPALTVSADAALGVGQVTLVEPFPQYDTPVGTHKVGTGLDLELALGLPWHLEAGVAVGARFAASGALTTANAYGRLFDPLALHLAAGASGFANPEFRVRWAFLNSPLVAVGFETRLLPQVAPDSADVIVPAIPARIRLNGVLRIDTELAFPVSLANGDTGGIDIPLAAWWQYERFFFGLLTGIFWNNPASGYDYGGVPTQLDVHAGMGIGYTVAGICDLKAQVLTIRIDDPNWSRTIGAGFGVGLVMP